MNAHRWRSSLSRFGNRISRQPARRLIYPFRGSGVLILIFSAILFSALSAMSGIFSILITIAAIGYLFSYMQNIIHATANEEAQMPELPGMDDVFGGFLRLAGTVVMSFCLTLGLMVARLSGVDISVSAIMISMFIGCLYFPMAFLVVAMKDNVMACNPLVVVPSILRVPGQYLITVILLISIFGVQEIGSLISSAAGSVAFTTTSMSVMFMSFGIKLVWSLIKVYLLTVNMRILGLLFLTQKEKTWLVLTNHCLRKSTRLSSRKPDWWLKLFPFCLQPRDAFVQRRMALKCLRQSASLLFHGFLGLELAEGCQSCRADSMFALTR